MQTIKQLINRAFLIALIVLAPAVVTADPRHRHHPEHEFLMKASRPELVDAFLRKDAEAQALSHDIAHLRQRNNKLENDHFGLKVEYILKGAGSLAVVYVAAKVLFWIYSSNPRIR